MRLFIVAALILIAMMVSPSSTPQAQQSNQAKPAQNHSPTANSAPALLVVPNTQPSDNVQPKAAEEPQKYKEQEKHSNDAEYVWLRFLTDLKVSDILIALFTGLLAFYTGKLWIATDKMWKSAQDQVDHSRQAVVAAQASAKAAADMARAVAAVELPRISVHDIKLFQARDDVTPVESEVGEGAPPSAGYLRVTLRNAGRTAAAITRICIDWSIVPQLLSDPPAYMTVTAEALDVSANEEITMTWPTAIRISDIEAANIRFQNSRLWVYGYIIYNDFIGDDWELGFSALWQPYIGVGDTGSPGFRFAGSNAYRYHRKRQTNQSERAP